MAIVPEKPKKSRSKNGLKSSGEVKESTRKSKHRKGDKGEKEEAPKAAAAADDLEFWLTPDVAKGDDKSNAAAVEATSDKGRDSELVKPKKKKEKKEKKEKKPKKEKRSHKLDDHDNNKDSSGPSSVLWNPLAEDKHLILVFAIQQISVFNEDLLTSKMYRNTELFRYLKSRSRSS